jgi:mRNA interferase MazF
VRRGDVYLVDLEPVRGSESTKTRPAVLVSNDAANRAAERDQGGVLTVVPVTSNVRRLYHFQVAIAAGEGGLTVDSKAQAEQVRSVDFLRLGRRLGTVPPATMRRLDDALRSHLGL